MLRPSFVVGSISHCSRALRVLWKDGVESVFPSTWLRSTVRDSKFFDPHGLMYEAEHLPFVSSMDNVLKNATLNRGKRLQ